MRTMLLPVLASGALLAAGCGGDSSASGGAGADDDKRLAFAKCMREGGIDIPDPGSGNRPQRIRIDRSVSPQTVQRLTKECRDKTGGGPRELSKAEQQEFRDRALKFSQCMRRNGVDMPDPSGEGGVLIQRSARGATGLNPESPAFKRAMKACQDVLPRPGRGGGDGPGVEVSP